MSEQAEVIKNLPNTGVWVDVGALENKWVLEEARKSKKKGDAS